MASIAASTTSVAPGGTVTFTVSGLAADSTYDGELVLRSDGSVAGSVTVTVEDGEDVGLLADSGTEYYVRINPDAGTLSQTSDNTFDWVAP